MQKKKKTIRILKEFSAARRLEHLVFQILDIQVYFKKYLFNNEK